MLLLSSETIMGYFRQFLEEKCFQTNIRVVDDYHTKLFNKFLSELDIEEVINYAEEYGRDMYQMGQQLILIYETK